MDDLDESRNTFRQSLRRAQVALAELPSEPELESSGATVLDTWPVLDDAALHGLAGDVVRLISPHTEADPIALLVSFLSEAGTILNRGPHLLLDGGVHPLLFWPVLVGNSSKSRKGTAGKRIQTLMSLADPLWTRGEAKGTLSSGEGLAYAVRDPQYKAGNRPGRPSRFLWILAWKTSASS
jgi:hypothetical protein